MTIIPLEETDTQMDWHIAQLDKDHPNWFINWATGPELQAFTLDVSRNGGDVSAATARLKFWVANRIFHRVLNAALSAGIIELP